MIINAAPQTVAADGTIQGGVRVEIKANGTLEESIASLATVPGFEYLADLKERDDVAWSHLEEIHDSWDESGQGLSGAAMAVVAIAIAVATNGAGAALLEGTALAESVIAAASLDAAIVSLATQAVAATASNKGNIFAALKDITSSETLKSVLITAITAGITAGVLKATGLDQTTKSAFVDGKFNADIFVKNLQINIQRNAVSTAITTVAEGGDLSEALKNTLISSAVNTIGAEIAEQIGKTAKELNADKDNTFAKIGQYITHAALGCGTASATGANCEAGAVGATVGLATSDIWDSTFDDLKEFQTETDEVTPEQKRIFEEWRTQGIDIARLSAALSVAAFGGDAQDVNAGANAGGNVAENNVLPLLILAAKGALVAWTAYEAYENGKAAIKLVEKYNAGELSEEDFKQAAIDLGVDAFVDLSLGKLKVLEKLNDIAKKAGLHDKVEEIAKAINKEKQIVNAKNNGTNKVKQAPINSDKLVLPTANPGTAQSRVNLAKVTDDNGNKRGWEYAIGRHGKDATTGSNKSKFSIEDDQVRALLQNKDVVKSPVYNVRNPATGQVDPNKFARQVDVGSNIGTTLVDGKTVQTSTVTIITNRKGDLINVFPGQF